MVIGGVNGLILIASRVGITIVFPVEQLPATTIVIQKLEDATGTEEKAGSSHVIVTVDVPATSDAYRA